MKIAFLDIKTIGEVPNLKVLEELGQVSFYQTTTPPETLARVQDQDIIITNKVVLNRAVLEQCAQLKLICVAATGTNNIDLTAAEELGIKVKNVVDYSTNSVAQLTFALLLQLINNVPYYDNYVKEKNYAQSEIFTHLGPSFYEISGKRFGIIGLGNIGRKVAAIAAAFGAEVVYYSASGKDYPSEYQRLPLDDFLETADIVSIHAPLNEFTRHLITYSRLKQMKRSALLLNVGRGGIVQETDLAHALNENLIAGAGLDVFESEPVNADNPLLRVNDPDKLVLTPHIAWSSWEARNLLIDKVTQNIRQFLDNKSY